jgi:hypothetical protein
MYLGGASSLIIPSGLFRHLGGFTERWSVQGSEDWICFARVIRNGHRVTIVKQPLVRYRVHGGNATADPDRVAVSMWSAVEYFAEEESLTHQELRRLRGRTAGLIARRFAANGRFREAMTWANRSIRRGTRGEGLRAWFLGWVSLVAGRLRRAGLRERPKKSLPRGMRGSSGGAFNRER